MDANQPAGADARGGLLARGSTGLLKDQAYAVIKRLILTEAFPPGSFLSERQLVTQMGGMSKTPIRQALERLQMDGLVQIAPQQGILVREVSLHEINDVFDIRIALETFVLDRLAGRLVPDQEAAIREHLAQADRCVQAGDEVTYAELDTAFHALWSEFLGNQEIVQVMRRNHDKLARVILRVLRRDKDRLRTSHADHVGIAEAVIIGDGALAGECILKHIEYAKRILIS